MAVLSGKLVVSPIVSSQTPWVDSQTFDTQFANCIPKINFKTEMNHGKQPHSVQPASDKKDYNKKLIPVKSSTGCLSSKTFICCK